MNIRKRLDAGRQDGFTLIELLIVIVILGILAGIVAFGVAQFREDSELSACKTDVKNVETAQAAYSAKNDGDYADNVALLVSEEYLADTPDSTGGIATSDSGAVTATLAGCV